MHLQSIQQLGLSLEPLDSLRINPGKVSNQFPPKAIDMQGLTPSITILVNLHLRRHNVSRVAKEWQPHVLNMKIVEGLWQGIGG